MASAVRQAVTQDAHRVVELVQQLAATIGEDSPVSATTVEDFLAYPGSGVLLAEEGGRVVGLLSYSVRPNLYHAANVCLIEDLIVDRAGLSVLRDPYSAKPYVLFYTTKRVGGGVQDFDAIKLLKFSAG